MLKARNVWKLLGHRGNVRKECMVDWGRLRLRLFFQIVSWQSDLETIG